jgi:topoisomerase-4 subunit A
MDALYAFTDCEISISPNACVIVADRPQFLGVDDLLRLSVEYTRELLKQELLIRKGELKSNGILVRWKKYLLKNVFTVTLKSAKHLKP